MQWMMAGGYLSLWNIIFFQLANLINWTSTSVHCIFQTWALNWKRLHPTSIWKTRSDFGIRLILMACVGTVDRQLFICICLYEWKNLRCMVDLPNYNFGSLKCSTTPSSFPLHQSCFKGPCPMFQWSHGSRRDDNPINWKWCLTQPFRETWHIIQKF